VAPWYSAASQSEVRAGDKDAPTFERRSVHPFAFLAEGRGRPARDDHVVLRWSGALGAELAEEAPVVGADVFFDHPAAVVEYEHVHEVPDDAGPVRFKAASR
jgi:hypothetical protein